MTEIDRAVSIEVTQADRDAAAEWMRAKHPDSAFTDLSITLAHHRQQAVAAEVAQIVAGLKRENGLCDCFARSEGECGCGAWSDYKTWPLERVCEWIQRGEYKETSGE